MEVIAHHSLNDLAGARNLIKKGLELFHKVLAGAIETLFYDQNQPLSKRSDLGKYLCIEDMRHSFKDFPSHYTRPRLDLEAGGWASSLGSTKNFHHIFINLDGSIEMAVRFKKSKAVALVKWLSKNGIEKIQEEHQQAITGRDNQIKALESTNEKHQQNILRLNKEIDDLIANRHAVRHGCFDNVLCFIKKNSKEVHPYYNITLLGVSISIWKNISDGLNLVTQTWRWLTNATIPMLLISGIDSSVK